MSSLRERRLAAQPRRPARAESAADEPDKTPRSPTITPDVQQTQQTGFSHAFPRDSNSSPTLVSYLDQSSRATSGASSEFVVDYEGEWAKWCGSREAAKEADHDAAGEPFGFPSDDLREIYRERVIPSDDRINLGSSSSVKLAPHFSAVQTALTLYSSDWRGVERYYRNIAIRPDRPHTAISPCLFETGPNLQAPEGVADEEEELEQRGHEGDFAEETLPDVQDSASTPESVPQPDESDTSQDRAQLSQVPKKSKAAHKVSPSIGNSAALLKEIPQPVTLAPDPSPSPDSSWHDPLRQEIIYLTSTTQQLAPNVVIDSKIQQLLDAEPSVPLPSQPKHSRPELFGEIFPIEDPPEASLVSVPFSEKQGLRFVLEPKELSFGLGISEPFFGSIALYDMAKKQKLSENFDFDLNSDVHWNGAPHPRSLRQYGVFSLPSTSTDIWLVCRVEKVLQGEPYDTIIEPYAKSDSLKDKDRERIATQVSSACARLGRFRTPFAWAMLPLFTDDRQLSLGSDAKISSFYRWKPDSGDQIIFDTFAEFSKAGSSMSMTKRSKLLPGRFIFNVEQWSPQLELSLSKFPRIDCEGNLAQPLDIAAPDSVSQTRSRSTSAPPSVAAASSTADESLAASPAVVREVASFLDDASPYPFTQLRHSLYVYPLTLNMSKVNSPSGVAARNILVQVQLMDNDDGNTSMLACNNKNMLPLRNDRSLTSVQYHTRTPVLSDEIKLSLPIMLTTKHNLLFSFFHVACNKTDQSDVDSSDVLTLVGQAFMPVLFKGRVLEKEITLPIATSLPGGYMSPESEATLRQHLIDPKKVIFKFRLRLLSTLYTSDKHLNAFFSSADALQRGKDSLRSLLNTSTTKAIQFLPTILNLIFSLLSKGDVAEKDGIAVESLYVLIELLHRLHGTGEVDLATILTQYMDHVFLQQPVSITSNLFRVFTAAWVTVLERAALQGQATNLSSSSADVTPDSPASPSTNPTAAGIGSASAPAFAPTSLAAVVGAAAVPSSTQAAISQSEWEKMHRFAGFFLRVVAKSMAAAVLYAQEPSDSTSRKQKRRDKESLSGKDKPHRRTSSASVRNSPPPSGLSGAENNASGDVDRRGRFSQEYLSNLRKLIILLTWEVQLRMRSGLTLAKEIIKKIAAFLIDLAAVCDRGYVLDLIHHVVDEQLSQYPDERLEFLKVVANYEHFAQLNLPLAFKLDSSTISNMDDIWRRRHYLATVLCRHTFPSILPDKALRLKALGILHMLFFKHDIDPRLRHRKTKQRVIRSYWPFVVGCIDSLDEIKRADFDEQRAICAAAMYILRHVDSRLLSWWWRRDTLMRQIGFLHLLSLSAQVFEHVGEKIFSKKMARANDQSKTSQQTKALLEAYFTDPQGTSRARYQSLREKRLAATRQASTSSVSGAKSTPTEETSDVPAGTWGRRWKHNFAGTLSNDGSVAPPIYDEVREAAICQEIGIIIADNLAAFAEEKAAELGSGIHPNLLMDALISAAVNLLQRRYPVLVQMQLLQFVRLVVLQYPKQLFTLNNTYCASLCAQLLALCQFHNLHVRVEASALIFLLMKKNFEHSSSSPKKRHFSRVKVQSIIALSKLVGGGRIKDPTYLLRALHAVERYSAIAAAAQPDCAGLPAQVSLLIQRLRTIMEDSVKINLHREDPEMLADLYHRIAASYRNAPDLRVTWLESLAGIHAHGLDNNVAWAEAAQCLLHIAALVAEYLDRLEPVDGLPPGCAAFEPICPSASEEQTMLQEPFRGLSDVTAGVDGLDGGVDEAHLFTEATLISVCEMAAAYLSKAQLYEAASEVLKLLVRVHDKNRDHGRLSLAYADLSDLHRKIRGAEQNHSRVLGSYYRVAFFGSKLGELDGQEFIYKEPRLTRLGEICDRLTSLFTAKLGSGTPVELYTKSGEVDRNKLDPSRCYIQITSVVPYFEEWELKDRRTDFERNFNINAFIFETPFTKGGKSHAASLADQYKMKTILLVEAAFPYMKKRLRVVEKRTEEVSPIENSLELIKRRVAALREELSHPSAKTLQPVLQGSVRLQVHAGPTEICKTFLSEPAKYPVRMVQELRRCLQEFLDVCAEALAKNFELIASSQLSFHRELEDGFATVRSEMEKFLQD